MYVHLKYIIKIYNPNSKYNSTFSKTNCTVFSSSHLIASTARVEKSATATSSGRILWNRRKCARKAVLTSTCRNASAPRKMKTQRQQQIARARTIFERARAEVQSNDVMTPSYYREDKRTYTLRTSALFTCRVSRAIGEHENVHSPRALTRCKSARSIFFFR